MPLRITTRDDREVQANAARSVQIQAEIWSLAQDAAQATPNSDVLALFIESLNHLIDIHTERVVVGAYARVPETLVYLLLVGSVLAVGMVGYNAGPTRHRSLPSAVILVLALGSVLTLVVDLDRPRDGFIQVSQQAMIDLNDELGNWP